MDYMKESDFLLIGIEHYFNKKLQNVSLPFNLAFYEAI